MFDNSSVEPYLQCIRIGIKDFRYYRRSRIVVFPILQIVVGIVAVTVVAIVDIAINVDIIVDSSIF